MDYSYCQRLLQYIVLGFPKERRSVNVVNCANCILFVCSKHLALGSDIGLLRLFETTFSDGIKSRAQKHIGLFDDSRLQAEAGCDN